MNIQTTHNHSMTTASLRYRLPAQQQIVTAKAADCDAVVSLFGALHAYNASLDPHFALAAGWESLLREQFLATGDNTDKLWLLVKDGEEAVGLLIAGVHTDSPLFKYRHWIEVEALYVAESQRGSGIAHRLLNRAYTWAEDKGLSRVQLYVTASNIRAQSVYNEQGFTATQAIMRKSLR